MRTDFSNKVGNIVQDGSDIMTQGTYEILLFSSVRQLSKKCFSIQRIGDVNLMNTTNRFLNLRLGLKGDHI